MYLLWRDGVLLNFPGWSSTPGLQQCSSADHLINQKGPEKTGFLIQVNQVFISYRDKNSVVFLKLKHPPLINGIESIFRIFGPTTISGTFHQHYRVRIVREFVNILYQLFAFLSGIFWNCSWSFFSFLKSKVCLGIDVIKACLMDDEFSIPQVQIFQEWMSFPWWLPGFYFLAQSLFTLGVWMKMRDTELTEERL